MRRQHGMAMVEALVAAGLLGLGLLGGMRLVAHALDAARQNRDQEQALVLASEALDCAVAGLAPCPSAESVTRQGVRYVLQLERTALGPHLTEITVRVRWGAGAAATSAVREQQWRTRVSDLPDWLGVSSP